MPTRRRDSARAAAAASALAALHLPTEALVARAREQLEDARQRATRRARQELVDAAGREGRSPAAGVDPP